MRNWGEQTEKVFVAITSDPNRWTYCRCRHHHAYAIVTSGQFELWKSKGVSKTLEYMCISRNGHRHSTGQEARSNKSRRAYSRRTMWAKKTAIRQIEGKGASAEKWGFDSLTGNNRFGDTGVA